MNIISVFSAGSLFIALLVGPTGTHKKIIHQYTSNYEGVLGTSLEMKVSAVSVSVAELAENAALSEIDRLNKIMSTYDFSSEVSLWLHTDRVRTKMSPDLFTVLHLFDTWRVQTNGALDASSELIGRLWKDAARRNEQPSAYQIARAVEIVKQPHWSLNASDSSALHLDNVPLVFNSFVKSYIISKACDAGMKLKGVSGMVVNIGGDIVVRGEQTEKVQVSNPKADAENDLPVSSFAISNKAVATSGNYRRGESVNGVWHSHIVDPRTGFPADNVISATVVADNATDAGALATAINILTPVESEKLVASIPHAEFMMITSNGQRIQSKGWTLLEKGNDGNITPTSNTSSPTDKTLDPNYELLIKLELSEIEGARIHRPYVAVWLIDKNKKPIRSIALWYNKPKYLNDMRSWYEAYYNDFTNSNSSVSSTTSATRPAGKYTLKWDGKDDNGQLVNVGTYTLMIEVAREHGTHQLMSSELDFTKKIKSVTLPGNVEVTGVSLEYLKK